MAPPKKKDNAKRSASAWKGLQRGSGAEDPEAKRSAGAWRGLQSGADPDAMPAASPGPAQGRGRGLFSPMPALEALGGAAAGAFGSVADAMTPVPSAPPSPDAVKAIAAARGGPTPATPPPSQRASANGDIEVAKAADTARRAVQTHGTSEKDSVDLNNQAGTAAAAKPPASKPAPAGGGKPATAGGAKPEDEAYQSLYGGTAKKDYGRIASVILPNGKKVYGDPESLKARVDSGGATWDTKPGKGDETEQGIRGSEDTTGVILGRKPGGAALSRALDAAATSGRPYSEALRANIDSILGPVASNPIDVMDQMRHRQMLEEKVRQEQARELGDVQHETEIAKNLQVQEMAGEDPLARERIRAAGQYGDAFLKAKTEQERDAVLQQRLAPIFAAMAQATPEQQQQLFQMAQLIIASYGRTAPSQSNQGLGFFGFQPAGGAPAAEAAK